MIKKTLLVTLLIVSCSLGAMAQGTLTPGQSTGVGCRPGYSCQNFSVTAPGIPNYSGSCAGTFEVRRSVTGAAGTVVFFSGGRGTDWYMANTPLANQLCDRLIALNYDIIQVKWSGNGWVSTLPGMSIGQATLAERPSTVIYWLKANRARGQRFVLGGGSNGSTQIAYSLAFYGVGAITDTAVLVAGPPYMEIEKGCAQVRGYAYAPNEASLVDLSYGYVNDPTAGACYNHRPTWFERERINSVNSGTTYSYPRTSVKILLGAKDSPTINNRGRDYFNLLQAKGQARLSISFVPNTGHTLQQTQQGIDAILNAITQP